jgi:hypothetical protein
MAVLRHQSCGRDILKRLQFQNGEKLVLPGEIHEFQTLPTAQFGALFLHAGQGLPGMPGKPYNNTLI